VGLPGLTPLWAPAQRLAIAAGLAEHSSYLEQRQACRELLHRVEEGGPQGHTPRPVRAEWASQLPQRNVAETHDAWGPHDPLAASGTEG
jgi:hypothetical protein